MMLNLWLMRMRFGLRQKLNSVSTITSLRFQPISSSRFSIPLCRMLAMPMVRPTLASDLAKLEQEFVHGYREGASVFYVTTTNEDGKTQEVLEADKASWGPIWNAKNDVFNTFLLSDPHLAHLTNMMFFVCDGNHRRQAWLNHIDRLHRTWGFLALFGGLNSPRHKWENWTCYASHAQHKQVSPFSFHMQFFILISSMFQLLFISII